MTICQILEDHLAPCKFDSYISNHYTETMFKNNNCFSYSDFPLYFMLYSRAHAHSL